MGLGWEIVGMLEGGQILGGEGTEARDEAKQSVAGVSESESSRGSDYR